MGIKTSLKFRKKFKLEVIKKAIQQTEIEIFENATRLGVGVDSLNSNWYPSIDYGSSNILAKRLIESLRKYDKLKRDFNKYNI